MSVQTAFIGTIVVMAITIAMPLVALWIKERHQRNTH